MSEDTQAVIEPKEHLVGPAEACTVVGFGLVVMGAGLMWGWAAAMITAGAILLVLGLMMALARSR